MATALAAPTLLGQCRIWHDVRCPPGLPPVYLHLGMAGVCAVPVAERPPAADDRFERHRFWRGSMAGAFPPQGRLAGYGSGRQNEHSRHGVSIRSYPGDVARLSRPRRTALRLEPAGQWPGFLVAGRLAPEIQDRKS